MPSCGPSSCTGSATATASCRGGARRAQSRKTVYADRIANAAGREYEPVDFTIDAEHAVAFAEAIGADPGAGIPPTYAAVYALGATAPQLFGDPEAEVDFGRLVHAEQEFAFARHPVAGEQVTARGRVTADIERRGARFVTFETAVADAAGEPVCTSRALFVVRA